MTTNPLPLSDSPILRSATRMVAAGNINPRRIHSRSLAIAAVMSLNLIILIGAVVIAIVAPSTVESTRLLVGFAIFGSLGVLIAGLIALCILFWSAYLGERINRLDARAMEQEVIGDLPDIVREVVSAAGASAVVTEDLKGVVDRYLLRSSTQPLGHTSLSNEIGDLFARRISDEMVREAAENVINRNAPLSRFGILVEGEESKKCTTTASSRLS